MPNFATDPLRPYNFKFSSVPGTNDIIVGSAGGLRVRDSTNAFNNLLLTDAGNLTIRTGIAAAGGITAGAGLFVTTAGITVTAGISALQAITGTTLSLSGQQVTLSGSPTAVTQILLGNSSVFGTVGSIFSSGAPVLTYNVSQVLGADTWNRSLAGTDSYALSVGRGGALQLYRSPSGTANGTLGAYFIQTILDISSAGNAVFLGNITANNALTVTAAAEADLTLTKTGANARSTYFYQQGTVFGLFDSVISGSLFTYTFGATLALTALQFNTPTTFLGAGTNVIINTSVGAGVVGMLNFQRNGATKTVIALGAADEFVVYDSSGANANLIVTNAGGVTVRNSLTVTTGGISVVAGLSTIQDLSVANNITFRGATGKIIPGATSFSHRNNADNADNILIADSGAVTFRSTVSGITTLTATTLAGTLSTAAQPNITSVGILASPHFTSPVIDSGGLVITTGDISLAAASAIYNSTGTTASIGTGSSGTVAPPAGNGSFLVAVRESGSQINAFGVLSQSGANLSLITSTSGASISLTTSGTNLVINNNSGGSKTYVYSFLRLH